MKTPPPDLTQRLLAVSEDVVGADPEPRLEDVARMVGASRATLYYYFSGRDDLLAFLLAAHVDEGAAQMRSADDPQAPAEQRLRAVVAAMLAFLGARPGMCAGLLGAVGAAGRMRAVLQVHDARIAGPVRELLLEGRAEGAFAFDRAADAANGVLGAALLGVLGRAMGGEDPADPAFGESLTEQIVRGVLAP